jgi:hypothetical protein
MISESVTFERPSICSMKMKKSWGLREISAQWLCQPKRPEYVGITWLGAQLSQLSLAPNALTLFCTAAEPGFPLTPDLAAQSQQ